MGEVAITYKIMTDSELENVDADALADILRNIGDSTYDIQNVELKPLAFGLKFIQLHVVMLDTEGLVDMFESKINSVEGVGEVEVLEMGLL